MRCGHCGARCVRDALGEFCNKCSSKRDMMIRRIELTGKTHALAVEIERQWHDNAWANSLHTDDANHDWCDHNERTYDRTYDEHVAEFFS